MIAARNRIGIDLVLLSNCWALPPSAPETPAGWPTSRAAASISGFTCDRAMPSARLKLIVTAGSWLWCAMLSGAPSTRTLVTADSGTSTPPEPRTVSWPMPSAFSWSCGRISMITW